jgi:hypothetical protein
MDGGDGGESGGVVNLSDQLFSTRRKIQERKMKLTDSRAKDGIRGRPHAI